MRLISNLLDNAVKYTPEGGCITVEASIQNSRVIIQVQDTGCGISPEFVDKIFERFFRIPDAEGYQNGFGLGLALCRGIAKNMEGIFQLIVPWVKEVPLLFLCRWQTPLESVVVISR